MRKFLSIGLCLLMIALLPFSAAAAEPTGRDTVRYDTNGGYILVDKNTGELVYADPTLTGDVVIPPTVSGVTVTSILVRFPNGEFDDPQDYYGFGNCDKITSLTIPGTVERVTDLGNIENLEHLILQEGVKAFNSNSFSSSVIKDVVLPKSLEEIIGGGSGDLHYKALLDQDNPHFVMDEQNILYSKDRTALVAVFGTPGEEYVIPDTVLTIEKHAFRGNTQISSITIPKNVQKIGTQSFQYCTGLLEVIFESKSVSIVTEAFQHCTNLQEVQLPSEEVILGTAVFGNCESLQSISLPPTGSLGLRSFTWSGLTHISIPAAYQLAAPYAFENCKQLETVIFRDGFQGEIRGMFTGCDALESIRIPETVQLVSPFYPSNEFGTQGSADVVIKGKRGSAAGRAAKENLNTFESEGDVALSFTDIAAHWAKSDIEWAYYNYIMDGVSPARFSPDTPTSRAMFVTMLKRLDRNYAFYHDTSDVEFTDVEWNSYYYSAVYWAAYGQITNGTAAATFSPSSNIRREDMVVMLMRYAEHIGMDVSGQKDLSAFGDASSVSDYAEQAVQWAVKEDILRGNSAGNLRPQASATRAETAAMMQRFYKLVQQKQVFTESSDMIKEITLRSYSDNLSYTITDVTEIEDFCSNLNSMLYEGVTEHRSTERGDLNVSIVYKNTFLYDLEFDVYPSRIEIGDATYTLKTKDSYLGFITKWAEKLENGTAIYN